MKWKSKDAGGKQGVRRGVDFLRKTRKCAGEEKGAFEWDPCSPGREDSS